MKAEQRDQEAQEMLDYLERLQCDDERVSRLLQPLGGRGWKLSKVGSCPERHRGLCPGVTFERARKGTHHLWPLHTAASANTSFGSSRTWNGRGWSDSGSRPRSSTSTTRIRSARRRSWSRRGWLTCGCWSTSGRNWCVAYLVWEEERIHCHPPVALGVRSLCPNVAFARAIPYIHWRASAFMLSLGGSLGASG